ncbi:MAG: 50S ribosomal protein L10 [Actinomycetia bacterium]|nr:50S ribosomal protein L10 [Actinomycetes bacterium]
MDNPRADKVAIVTEVKERFSGSPSVLVTEYRGLSVKALAELRRNLRPAGGAYKVYKNTLVRRAASEAGVDIEEYLVGPTALTFTETTPEGEAGDVVTVAKVLNDFAAANPDLVIKGGLLDGAPLDADGVRQLANIEPRDVLLAKLAGLLAAPMQQFAGLLQAVPRDFAYGLQALIEKGGGADAPAPEADAPAEAPSGDDGAVDVPEASDNNETSDEGSSPTAAENDGED